MKKAKGFTLVELLVVIGIIALLISILLPALNKVREAGNNVKCTSNVRQLVMASMMFQQAHRGNLPPASDHSVALGNDPNRIKYSYRSNGFLKDWASALLPFLGSQSSQDADFETAPEAQIKIFNCPSDPYLDIASPGLRLYNNVSSTYQPISYGINADITCLVNTFDEGKFDASPSLIGTYKGPQYGWGSGDHGKPLNARFDKINQPARTMLFADCGTRPQVYFSGNAIENNEALAYSSYWSGGGTLESIANASWLRDRIPYNRHKDRINVGFADGHAETVLKGNFREVRVSPYRY